MVVVNLHFTGVLKLIIWSTPTSPDDVMPTLNYSSNCLLLLDYILYK